MNEFWIGFWSNLMANVAFVALVAVAGYFAKASIVKSLHGFIRHEVSSTVQQVKDLSDQKENNDRV